MYNFLQGTKAIEITNYWPDAVGQYLADLGAEIIKVEDPRNGGLTRLLGGPGGLNVEDITWNRGKKSVGIDLKAEEGCKVFLELARTSDFVIDGLRAGALESFGIGYDHIKEVNPGIVFVMINGWGETGPYRRLATHGGGFDSFAALSPPAPRPDGFPEYDRAVFGESHFGPIAATLQAALAALAAYIRRVGTGEGARIEVSEGDGAVSCTFDRLFHHLNQPPAEETERERGSATRYQYYPTKDGKVVMFQPIEEKFWRNFCEAIGREDLIDRKGRTAGTESNLGDEWERQELSSIMRTKTRAEWIAFFIEKNIPGAPVNTIADLAEDPHFKARQLLVDYMHPQRGKLQVFGTAIKDSGQGFQVSPAPELGQHTDEVLTGLGLSTDEISRMKSAHVIR